MQKRFYDRRCLGPDAHTMIDCFEPTEAPVVKCHCGYMTERVWLSKSTGVCSDECDIEIKHGLCWDDGTPRRFTSKAEIARVAKEKGYVNYVQHQPTKGGDRSKYTSRWI